MESAEEFCRSLMADVDANIAKGEQACQRLYGMSYADLVFAQYCEEQDREVAERKHLRLVP